MTQNFKTLDDCRLFLKHKTLLVSIITKNVEHTITSVLSNVERYTSLFKDYVCVVVDGHSSDNTYNLLMDWRTKDSLKRIILKQTSQGKSRPLMLSEARNMCIRLLERKFDADTYLLILDADEINAKPVDLDGFLSCWMYDKWDMMGANQTDEYYDIWALRNVDCPYDCWDMVRLTGDEQKHVRNHQKPKPTDHPVIECLSCFGGSGVYNTDQLLGLQYYSFLPGNKEVCEHVTLHKQLTNRGGRLFINPRWINK
jgi:glycosyltransferase involved in cell wall biosynthesis